MTIRFPLLSRFYAIRVARARVLAARVATLPRLTLDARPDRTTTAGRARADEVAWRAGC